MTTAKELRAAAEMILALKQADVSGEPAEATRERLFPGMSADAALAKAEAGIVGMCSHILATAREDDEEPISDVWWRTLPRAWFADLYGEEKLCLLVHDDSEEDPDNRALLVLSDDGSWGFWEQDRKTNELHSPHHNSFRPMKTRGDVRRLCSALGIPLPSTP